MKWKYQTTNKRGFYGETDFDKKVIKVNKRRHRKKGIKRITPNKDGSEKLIMTETHELLHKKYPRKSEKAVEGLARAMVAHMTPKKKRSIYNKFN